MYLSIPIPHNEKVLSYEHGSREREELIKTLTELESNIIEIPAIINGKEVYTGKTGFCIQPHCHSKRLAEYHKVGEQEIKAAIDAAEKAHKEWERMPFYHRSAIFLKAAELLATKYRSTLNAATMLCQSKNVQQAEIDAACELIDFWRFNVYFAQKIYEQQPLVSPPGERNFTEYRSLEGFVLAITPFNFTSIAGNLPTAPALMGNSVVWKPAGTAIYSGYYIMKILKEAGLPDGVINFIPGSGAEIGKNVIDHPSLAGIHFTGSTQVFNQIWQRISGNLSSYNSYPRVVGETGGKDFIVAHPSADIKALAVASLRGAYEYQGQKCSAVSRIYLPQSIYNVWLQEMTGMLQEVRMGGVQDFKNFVNAVIDKKSFDNLKSYIERAKNSSEAEVLWGGKCDDSEGYFIEPTIIRADNSLYETMTVELFGPILTVSVYDDNRFDQVLKLCDSSTNYALTGAVFSQDRTAICKAYSELRHAAGNFYINDKPTGAVVGQQPFGGGRASGTNDKAGSALNLQRWISARSIKETFNPPTDFKYPFMK